MSADARVHGGRAPAPLLANQWIALVRRRWQLAVGVWMVTMIVGGAVLWAIPREYESTARFLVKNARQDLVVGPAEGSPVMYRDEVAEETINTELELLRSRDILARVVEELHLDGPYLNQGKDPSLATELAVRDLGRALSAATIRKTNLIQVTYGNTNPQLASDVLKRVSDAYLEAHLVMHSSPGSYQLFKQQGEAAEQQLQEAQQELAGLAKSANLLAPDEQKREVMESLTAAETQYAELKAQIQDAVARVRTSSRKLQEVPRRIQAEVRNVPNQESVDRLTVMIVELKNKRTELSTKFRADDRRIRELDQQISDTTTALTQARTLSAEQQSTNINPAWTELDAESMRAQLALAGLVGKETELGRRLSDYRHQLQELAQATPQYEAVARRVAREQANYLLYTKKEEEARIVEALDRQRISNVVLAQAPYVSSVPAKPDLRVGFVIAFSTASALAALAAVLAEHLGMVPLLERKRRRPMQHDGDSSPVAALS